MFVFMTNVAGRYKKLSNTLVVAMGLEHRSRDSIITRVGESKEQSPQPQTSTPWTSSPKKVDHSTRQTKSVMAHVLSASPEIE